MKTLYLECRMGVAGDMLSAALLELMPDQENVLAQINQLGIPRVTMSAEKTSKCGIVGTHYTVKVGDCEEGEEPAHSHEAEHRHEHHHEHHHEHVHKHTHQHTHRSMEDIYQLVDGLALSDQVKRDVLAVYSLIAEAESKVHDKPVDEIHFHEVGSLDAIADVATVCLLMEKLGVDKVIVSPIHVGSGTVRCAHGILPVPAPATALLLKGIPIYSGAIDGELCTPTGAALLHYFGNAFGEMPVMRIHAIGYGMGKKDFPAANCVRAFLGETEE